MKAEVQEVINDIKKSLKLLSEKNNIIDSRSRLEEIESITNKADFWSNLDSAKLIMKERQSIEAFISNYESIKKKLYENIDLYKLDYDFQDVNELYLDDYQPLGFEWE